MDWINTYVSVLKRYVAFEGAANRVEFWKYTAVSCVVIFVLAFVDGLLGTCMLVPVYWLATLLPSLGVSARRLRDAGLSPWWLLLGAIGLGIVPFVMCILPSKQANA